MLGAYVGSSIMSWCQLKYGHGSITPIGQYLISKDDLVHIETGRQDIEDAFYVADLGDVVNKWRLWYRHLPRVKPYYAVKCNDDPAVVALLAKLGSGFDCASKEEISLVLSHGVPASGIVYANPCKQTSHLLYAARQGVDLMTFDSEAELYKIKQHYPEARLVLRLAHPDDSKSKIPLSKKYGVKASEALSLLQKAADLKLNTVGLSYHVGSGSYDVNAFTLAVVCARSVYDQARHTGITLSLLDIGGGFPGTENDQITFTQICQTLGPTLDKFFPPSLGVSIIAEPGRYFVASAFTVYTTVIGKKQLKPDRFSYYLNDGVYGSFNCIITEPSTPVIPEVLDADLLSAKHHQSSLYGPTCDSIDMFGENYNLPELHMGQRLLFRNMGAYSRCLTTTFNGMSRPVCYYVIKRELWDAMLNDSRISHYAAKGKSKKIEDDTTICVVQYAVSADKEQNPQLAPITTRSMPSSSLLSMPKDKTDILLSESRSESSLKKTTVTELTLQPMQKQNADLSLEECGAEHVSISIADCIPNSCDRNLASGKKPLPVSHEDSTTNESMLWLKLQGSTDFNTNDTSYSSVINEERLSLYRGSI